MSKKMKNIAQSEVLMLKEQGTAEAYQPSTDENQDAVQEAIDSCPVSAIVWED